MFTTGHKTKNDICIKLLMHLLQSNRLSLQQLYFVSYKWIFLVKTGQQIKMDFVIMLLLSKITVSFLGGIYGFNDVLSGGGWGGKAKTKG